MIQLHPIIESVREGVIEPDDLIKLTIDDYMPNWRENLSQVPTVQGMIEHIEEVKTDNGGELPDDWEFIDFDTCHDCYAFIVYDERLECFRHLVEAPNCSLAIQQDKLPAHLASESA